MDEIRLFSNDFNDALKVKEIKIIEKRLQTIEKELEKVRDYSAQIDGWQTQRFSKKSRKYDYLALEKFELLNKLKELNLSFNFDIGKTGSDKNGVEFKIVSCDDYFIYCDFEGNKGDVVEFRYHELKLK